VRLARHAFLAACISCTTLGVGLFLYAGGIHSAQTIGIELLQSRASAPEGPVIPSAPPPCLAPGEPRLSFFLMGDAGWQTPAKSAVAAAMARASLRAHPDFVMLAGDNFYPAGVRSNDDPAWNTGFTDAFWQHELQIPFYAAFGNHDHEGNSQAQVEHAQDDPRWRMPAAYFSFSRELAPGCDVQFFVLDTTPLRLGDHSADEQMRWFEEKLARSTAHWRIVVGHHPVVSGGHHGGSSRVRNLVEPLFERYGVDLYLSGHDHDLQLLKPSEGYLQVVSGSGSTVRDVHRQAETLFAEAEAGFVWILVTESDLWIQYVTAAKGARFTYRMSPRP